MLHEKVNELQEQLYKLKGENTCFKTKTEKLGTEQKKLREWIRTQEQSSRKIMLDICNPYRTTFIRNNVLLDTL